LRVIVSVGGVFHSLRLVEALAQRGFLARYITSENAAVSAPQPTQYVFGPELIGAAVRHLPGVRRIVPWNLVKDNLFDLLARRHVSDCDIFHVWNTYALWSLRKAKRFGAKIVVDRGSAHPLTQEALLREEYRRFGVRYTATHPWLIRKQLKEFDEADCVLVPSQFAYQSFVDQGFDKARLTWVPFGADLEHFAPSAHPPEKFRVLFVGSLSLQKGVQYLLEAFSQLRLKDAELVLCGAVTDDAKPTLAKYAGQYRLIGPFAHSCLPDIYRRASIYVQASIQEGSALAIYEAMACGLPVIVTTHTGAIARDGIDGFVVPIRDARAIADRILELYEDKPRRETMGRSARARALEFTWDRYADSVIQVYERLLG